MTSKDSGDPDYYSAWRGAQVSSVTRAGDVVTVDFKQLPQTKLDEAAATIATQQLVYTVQGAMNNARDRVQVTQQGKAGSHLFGHIDTSRPFSRAEASKVQALVWIDNLADGQVTKSPLTVTGIAAAFEGTVNWRATNLKTRADPEELHQHQGRPEVLAVPIALKLHPGQ